MYFSIATVYLCVFRSRLPKLGILCKEVQEAGSCKEPIYSSWKPVQSICATGAHIAAGGRPEEAPIPCHPGDHPDGDSEPPLRSRGTASVGCGAGVALRLFAPD